MILNTADFAVHVQGVISRWFKWTLFFLAKQILFNFEYSKMAKFVMSIFLVSLFQYLLD